MSRSNSRRSRLPIKATVIIVVVLAIIGLLGWQFYNKPEPTSEKASSDDSSQQAEVPVVENKEDLKDVETFLSDTDIDNLIDTTEIDAAFSE